MNVCRIFAVVGALLVSGVALGAAVPAPKEEQGYLRLTFEHLASFTFTPPGFDPTADQKAQEAASEAQIPAPVKAWNGRKVAITGYMVPTKLEKGVVTELMLMRNTLACCYGTVPNLNEWVVVKLTKGIAPLMDVPVVFYGELKVQAAFENGYLTGLYELKGERMEQG